MFFNLRDRNSGAQVVYQNQRCAMARFGNASDLLKSPCTARGLRKTSSLTRVLFSKLFLQMTLGYLYMFKKPFNNCLLYMQ